MTDFALPSDLPDLERAAPVVDKYRLPSQPIYVIGTLDTGITVVSQQIRALNLVWGLVSSGRIRCGDAEPPDLKIAIVGGGFAGMTTAAALIKKAASASITIFERRDNVLPLQQGSDTRWLHPHIYDWPLWGSDSPSAGLPVLNWTASRASDVAVQALAEWSRTLLDPRASDFLSAGRLRIYCNARHLRVSGVDNDRRRAHIEWVGDGRDPLSPANPSAEYPSSVGCAEDFDLVVLAAGFGLERETKLSYWRNDTLGQPELTEAVANYIVSGSGDGAMVDLFRIRIAQFRQDRILAELFAGKAILLERLRRIDASTREGSGKLFELFSDLADDPDVATEFEEVRKQLSSRLRRDTRAVLHVRDRRFAELFDSGRVSFQNRLLAFILYRAGGFHPSTDELDDLAQEYGVSPNRIIRRHGTYRHEVLERILPDDLHDVLKASFADSRMLHQGETIQWTGGYFDYPGPRPPEAASDALKAHWRKEYLPSPTEVVTSSFCAAVAGIILSLHPHARRLRVTFHRRLSIGSERVLQQCCEYAGDEASASGGGAGRTFPEHHATIGTAYLHRRIVRTRSDAEPSDIRDEMATLGLSSAARSMAEAVQSIAAIPLITRVDIENSYVIGVLYVDSEERDLFAGDGLLLLLRDMSVQFLSSLEGFGRTSAGRVFNYPFWGETPVASSNLQALPPTTLSTLEEVDIDPPSIEANVPQINLDYGDVTLGQEQ